MTAALLLLGKAKPSNSDWDILWESAVQLLLLQSCRDFVRRNELFCFGLLTPLVRVGEKVPFFPEEPSLRYPSHLTGAACLAKSLMFATTLSHKRDSNLYFSEVQGNSETPKSSRYICFPIAVSLYICRPLASVYRNSHIRECQTSLFTGFC